MCIPSLLRSVVSSVFVVFALACAAPDAEVKPAESPALVEHARHHSWATVFVVDLSGSMSSRQDGGSSNSQRATHAIRESIQQLGEDDVFGVVGFGRTDRVLIPLASGRDRKLEAAEIEGLEPSNETSLLAGALDTAHTMLRDYDADRRRVVVFSEGEVFDRDNAALAAHRALQDEITIDVVEFVPTGRSARLGVIARLGGGRIAWVAEAGDIPSALSQLRRS